MHDVVSMHKVECKQYLFNDVCSLGFIPRSALCYDLAHEVSSSHQFLYDVVVLLIFHEFKDAHNVSVRYRFDDLELVSV